jgi:hypothetical protein
MLSNKNLWGELPKSENIRTPYTILKEQASLLTEITKGLLIGEVKLSSEVDALSKFASSIIGEQSQSFVAFLRIKAPSLNNYTYSVVKIQYPIKLYPVLVKSLVVENFQSECSSEEEFENALGQILSSQEVKQVISALLAQIHADIPKQ